MVSSLTPTVDTKNPLAQIPPPSQYTLARKPNFARSARLVLLFSMFTTLLTLYRGGISMCRCTWSLSTPDRREVPVRIVLPHFVQFYSEVTCYSWGQNLAAESGHPHNVILCLVYRMSLSVQPHSYIISQRRWTLLSPPPSRAGNSRWIELMVSKRSGLFRK